MEETWFKLGRLLSIFGRPSPGYQHPISVGFCRFPKFNLLMSQSRINSLLGCKCVCPYTTCPLIGPNSGLYCKCGLKDKFVTSVTNSQWPLTSVAPLTHMAMEPLCIRNWWDDKLHGLHFFCAFVQGFMVALLELIWVPMGRMLGLGQSMISGTACRRTALGLWSMPDLKLVCTFFVLYCMLKAWARVHGFYLACLGHISQGFTLSIELSRPGIWITLLSLVEPSCRIIVFICRRVIVYSREEWGAFALSRLATEEWSRRRELMCCWFIIAFYGCLSFDLLHSFWIVKSISHCMPAVVSFFDSFTIRELKYELDHIPVLEMKGFVWEFTKNDVICHM